MLLGPINHRYLTFYVSDLALRDPPNDFFENNKNISK